MRPGDGAAMPYVRPMSKISIFSVIVTCLIAGVAMEAGAVHPIVGVLSCFALGAAATAVHLICGRNS